MPRTARTAPGGVVFHVLNRANARARIFAKDRDYQTFEQIMAETTERVPVRILAYCPITGISCYGHDARAISGRS